MINFKSRNINMYISSNNKKEIRQNLKTLIDQAKTVIHQYPEFKCSIELLVQTTLFQNLTPDYQLALTEFFSSSFSNSLPSGIKDFVLNLTNLYSEQNDFGSFEFHVGNPKNSTCPLPNKPLLENLLTF